MKKIFYLASIAALALSSCAKDETTQAAIEGAKGGSKIVAAMGADVTRTHLETADEVNFEYRWSLGDQLGIYGFKENTLSNAAFVLDNASDNSPVGVFTSQHKLDADKSYMAVYPRFAEPLFDVVYQVDEVDDPSTTNVTEKLKKIDGGDVVMKILPEQKYQDKTFYTTTAPAISGDFAVNKDGEANISMQPVADYLMVNLTSTEEIKTLTLALLNHQAGEFLPISGTSNLASYWMMGEDGMEYRYYIPEGSADVAADFDYKLDGYTITLKTDESYKTVACHEPNTYVFTIPAGLLGMGNDIEAYIWVNEDPAITSATATSNILYTAHFLASSRPGVLNSTNFTKLQGKNTNAQMNYSTPTTADNAPKSDRIDENKTGYKQVVKKLENTVFWVNEAIDTNYDNIRDTRNSFMYNPNEDVIIEHEAQLLEYIVEYSKGNTKFYGHDAFLCSGATFDFSEANMVALATELKNKGGENNVRYESYIAEYLKDFDLGGGFPCFPATGNYVFSNNFIGNGAQIINIFQPLKSEMGIFGGSYDHDNVYYTPYVTRAGENVSTDNDGASINDVTFANINAWYDQGLVLNGNYDKYIETTLGYILAGSFNGKISNVDVINAQGGAVMGNATVAQLNGLTLTDNDKLFNIFENLTLDANVDLSETWADLATVNYEIFEKITPADNKNTAADADLNVITVDNTNATYAKLTSEVDITNDHAAAVVINDVSFWTGDKFAAAKDYKVNDTLKGKYIQYAEELANGNVTAGDGIAVLSRDMDLNYANLCWYNNRGQLTKHYPWTMVEYTALDGADNSISQVNMFAYDNSSRTSIEEIAPFKAATVKNITLNDVVIDINTQAEDSGLTVPKYIAGVSVNAANLTKVTINDVAINAYRADGTSNTQANYAKTYSARIGWVSALSANTRAEKVAVNGAYSSAKGIAGVFGEITIGTALSDSAQLTDVTVAGVDGATVNPAISKFTQYKDRADYNALGTVVGLVVNKKTANAADIKFYNSKPVFMFDAPIAINVLYNDSKEASLENAPAY